MKKLSEILKNKMIRIALLLGILSILFNSTLGFIMIDGRSMHPYYKNGEIVFIDKLSYRFAPIKRFDIVIIETKDGEKIIKRIVAKPGELISYKNKNFYLNEKILQTDFYNSHSDLRMVIEPIRVPKDHYFVIGDNREDSVYSLFHKNQIVGKVIF